MELDSTTPDTVAVNGREYKVRKATFQVLKMQAKWSGGAKAMQKVDSVISGIMINGAWWKRPWRAIADKLAWRSAAKEWMKFCAVVFENPDAGLELKQLSFKDVKAVYDAFFLLRREYEASALLPSSGPSPSQGTAPPTP